MSEYDRLKKIIPPDQALANQAISRSLRQVKRITDSQLPSIANAVSTMETNTNLGLINALETPLPQSVANFWANTFASGTGAGNAVTVNDTVGIAAGVNVNDQMPTVVQGLQALADAGQLVSLTANTGNPMSGTNGIYTQMQYCLGNAYGAAPVIPPTTYWTGGSFLDFDDAFANGLIPAANSAISNITSSNSSTAGNINTAWETIAAQIKLNQDNLQAAGVDIGNIVIGDWANSNITANQQSVSLSVGTRLHSIGLDIAEGGAAQFFAAVANTSSVAGQAVVASLREGRNIQLFNSTGLGIDTQLSDVNANTPVANNLSDAQYSANQARANIVI
jgi:hypothetical protein